MATIIGFYVSPYPLDNFDAKTVFKHDAVVISMKTEMQVKGVLFDLFDTLVLVESNEAYYPTSLKKIHEYLTKNGINASFENFKQAYFEVRDKFYSESRQSLEEPHFNVRLSQTLKKLGYDLATSDPRVTGAAMAFGDEFIRHTRLDKETKDVLQKLHGKYKIGIVSNFALPEYCWKLLEKFNIKQFFDAVIISGEINRRKPSPEIFQKALNILNIDASKVVFVGDTLDTDIRGSRAVGMKTILIQRRPIENADVKPDKIITNLSDLLTILEDC